MDKVWTTPVKLSVALAALCVVGTFASVAIGWKALSIAQQQLAIAQQHSQEITRSSAASGGTPVKISYVPFVVSSALAVLSMLVLFLTVWYVYKRGKGTRSVFKIVTADWGNSHRREPIDDVLGLMPSNAIAFFLNPDAFKPYTTPDKSDPAPGPGKYLDISYTSGPSSGKLRRHEGEWVILPEDPALKAQLDQLNKRADENFKKYSDESREHGETKNALRGANKEKGDVERDLAACKAQLDHVRSANTAVPSSSWVRFITAYPTIAGPPEPGQEPAQKPQKAKCEFLNSANVAYKVKLIRWECGSGGLDADVWAGSIQLRIQGEWYPNWLHSGELHVAPGEQFRFWAFPKGTLTDEQFKARVNAGHLGTVHLLINGKEVSVVVG